jgi:hypothetical protein
MRQRMAGLSCSSKGRKFTKQYELLNRGAEVKSGIAKTIPISRYTLHTFYYGMGGTICRMYCKSGGIGAKKTIQGMGHDTIHTLTCSRMSAREI